MNIHFHSKELFEDLKRRSLIKVKMGSHLYGLENEDSDIDYLYLYFEDLPNLCSLNWLHHQLQYKEDGVDHVFTSVRRFLRSILSGDSTLNFEVLMSEEFKECVKNNSLRFLLKYKHEFVNYSIIKSYLGFAKRDLKSLKDAEDINAKKASHFVRSVLFAQRLLDGNLDITAPDFLKRIKNRDLVGDALKVITDDYAERMVSTRKELTTLLDRGEIGYSMNTESLNNLDKDLISVSQRFASGMGINVRYEHHYLEAISRGDVKY